MRSPGEGRITLRTDVIMGVALLPVSSLNRPFSARLANIALPTEWARALGSARPTHPAIDSLKRGCRLRADLDNEHFAASRLAGGLREHPVILRLALSGRPFRKSYKSSQILSGQS